MDRSTRVGARFCAALLLLIALLSVSQRVSAEESGASAGGESPALITMGEAVPFASNASGEIGLMSPKAGALRRIETHCDLERGLAVAIAQEARKLGVAIAVVPRIEDATGRVLSIRIEGAVGQLGGAMSGTKSLTLRGELREGEVVIASFVAREQRTALTAGTCASLTQCGDKLARHIAKWLKKPVMRARLGSA